MEVVTYLSLGSNLGDRLVNLENAMSELSKIGKISAVSNIYENPPLGFDAEMKFLNLCLEFITILTPNNLLLKTQEIEKTLGRTSKSHNGYQSRVIDIDIIYYDCNCVDTEKLKIPHPQRTYRKFVLAPLNDIAGGFIDPELKKSVNQLLSSCASVEDLVLFEKEN